MSLREDGWAEVTGEEPTAPAWALRTPAHGQAGRRASPGDREPGPGQEDSLPRAP